MKVGESKPVNDELRNFQSLYKDKLFGVFIVSCGNMYGQNARGGKG